MPAYGENDLIDLGGSYTQKQVCAALKKMKKDEAPEITQLRAHIVDQIELKKLFYTAVKNINQANKYGISFGDEFTGEFIEDHCIGIGVMALEHSAP